MAAAATARPPMAAESCLASAAPVAAGAAVVVAEVAEPVAAPASLLDSVGVAEADSEPEADSVELGAAVVEPVTAPAVEELS